MVARSSLITEYRLTDVSIMPYVTHRNQGTDNQYTSINVRPLANLEILLFLNVVEPRERCAVVLIATRMNVLVAYTARQMPLMWRNAVCCARNP